MAWAYWRSGRNALHEALDELPQSAARCLEGLRAGTVPRLVLDHLHFSGALPECAIALSVLFADVPRIRASERVQVEAVADGFWHVTMRFGFVEVPDLRRALAHSGRLRRGRIWLFGFLCRNTAKVVDRFNLPPDNVVELARQFRI